MSTSPADRGFGTADDGLPVEHTADLLRGARTGDAGALERLVRRYMPPLRRWAHGRLPNWSRELLDTDDLVQEVLLHTLQHLGDFKPERVGSLNGYLRTALRNRIRDELRRVGRHASAAPTDGTLPGGSPTPLEDLVGREAFEDYEHALEAISAEQREAVVARIELGLTYQEIADQLHKPTADAARMIVARALVRLARSMRHEY